MYLALLKIAWLFRQSVDWVQIHALRYFGHEWVQAGSGNRGLRAAKLPLSDWRFPFTVVLALFEACLRVLWQLLRWLLFLNTRSVPEFVLSLVKLVVVCSVLSVAGLYGYLSGAPDPEMLAKYQQLHQQRTATALLDQQGQLVGAIPNPQQQTTDLGSLSIELVPPVYWDVLDDQTQRQLNFTFQDTRLSDLLLFRQTHYKGVAASDILAAINPFAENNSSLLQRLNNGLSGIEQSQSRCFGVFSSLCNTFSSLRLAKHAFPYLAQNKGSEFKRWVAMHNPLRGQTDDFNGLRATAETVFSKLPEQLSNAEQALLAVAQLKGQALLELDDWSALKNEATAITEALYQRNQVALADEIKQGLAVLQRPSHAAPIQTGSLIADQSWLTHDAQFNLRQRTQAALGGFAEWVNQRLAEEYARTHGGRLVSDAQISLAVDDNIRFQTNLKRRFKTFEQSCTECGLSHSFDTQSNRPSAVIRVLVADQAGQLVRYYSQGKMKERSVAHLSALPAAVLLASKGNQSDTRFCNQMYRQLPSSIEAYPKGNIHCETPLQAGHSASFLESIHLKSALPLFNALREQASADELAKLYQHLGFQDMRSRQGNASHLDQYAYEMSYGMVQSSPLHLLELNHQLGELLFGEGDPSALQSISQFLVTDMKEKRRYLEFSETPSRIELVGHYLRTQAAKDTLKRLLSPESTPRQSHLGSLRSIKNLRILSIKTGQNLTKKSEVKDQWLLATLSIRGKRYSVSAFVGNDPDQSQGFAKRLAAEKIFYPIVAEITNSLD